MLGCWQVGLATEAMGVCHDIICPLLLWSSIAMAVVMSPKPSQDDEGHGDEGFDVEELMRNVALDVLLWRRNKGFDNFEVLDKVSRDLLYEDCKVCDKEHTM
jgi:hypothetical protein